MNEYTQNEINEATALLQSFYEQSSSENRVLIDEYAKNKLRSNTDLAMQIAMNPQYKFGKVNKVCLKFKWDSKSNDKSSMICDIIKYYNDMKFTNQQPCIIFKNEGSNTINLPEPLIRFLKACLLGQVSKNEKFSKVVALYTKEVIESLKTGIVCPVKVDTQDKFEKTIVNELNAFYEYVLKENNIEANTTVIDTKAKEKKSTKTKKPVKRTKKSSKVERVDAEVLSKEECSALDRMCKMAKDNIIDVE